MKYVAIINPLPLSGKKCEELFILLPSLLSPHDVSLHLTTHPGHAIRLANEAVRSGADVIISVGGDGTVNEVINAMADSDCCLGIIPTGTANDLADYLNIPRSIADACRLLRDDHCLTIDLLSVNGKYFATTGGIGVPSHTIAMAQRMKRTSWRRLVPDSWFRSYVYRVALLSSVFSKWKRHQTVTIRNGVWSTTADAFSVTTSNQPSIGGRWHLSPEARNNDGLLNLCLIQTSDDYRRLTRILSTTVRGTHYQLPNVTSYESNHITIDSFEPVPFFADGELLPPRRHFDIRVHPGKLRVVCPQREAKSC